MAGTLTQARSSVGWLANAVKRRRRWRRYQPREAGSQIDSQDRKKIENAFSDADDELTKPEPDKDKIGRALDRALDYAKKADGFASNIEALKPHVTNVAAWLGSNWYKLLGVVGLAV